MKESASQRPLLVVAHPGHELRVHGWLESVKPVVWILTDGSGHTKHSRINSSTRVLEAAGAVRGSVYGRFTDQALYDAVLGFHHHRFIDLVDELVEALISYGGGFIAGDAEEGYNPAHDICRLVINAAVARVNNKSKTKIANYDFGLVGSPSRCQEKLLKDSLWLNLDDAAFARKLAAARNYPELQSEVESALNGFDRFEFRKQPDLAQRARSEYGITEVSDFRTECLRPVNLSTTQTNQSNGDIPFYESYGEKQVKAGHYSRVLRYREHVIPLSVALNAHVERTN